MRRLALVAATLAAVSVGGVRAAEAPRKPEPQSAPHAAPNAAPPAGAPTAPAPPPPPYEQQLLRLSEMMGALAYLRDLCGAADGAEFRSKMKSLLDADGIGQSQRDLIAGAYNQGFEGYRLTYRTCTPAAGEVIARYLAETARLSAELVSRYGG
jgi:uncharacterized protein (TIGR02301 family)